MISEQSNLKLTFASFLRELYKPRGVLFKNKTCTTCFSSSHSDYNTKCVCLWISFILFGLGLIGKVPNPLYYIVSLVCIFSFMRFLHLLALYYEYCAIIEAHPESKLSGKFLT